MAKVPYNYDKILVDEYEEKALVMTEFNGYVEFPLGETIIANKSPDTDGIRR